MHTLGVANGERAVDEKPGDGVLVVDVVIGAGPVGEGDGGGAGAVFVDLVVFAVVGVCGDAGEEGVSAGFVSVGGGLMWWKGDLWRVRMENWGQDGRERGLTWGPSLRGNKSRRCKERCGR